VFDEENLYDLVNGQADSFFAYNFQRVAVGDYVPAAKADDDQDDEDAAMRIAVWQLATPGDAYGLFTTYRSGTPLAIGPGTPAEPNADADPGRRLDFWQDRYFVRLFARQPVPEANLQTLAGTVAQALPGDAERPALIDRLPVDGLVPRSPIFFHSEISFQDRLWLGGENLLGLSADTDGVLARYETDGGTAQLLLVEYPDTQAAAAGLAALQDAEPGDLVAAETAQNLLGAVLGPASQSQAQSWLDQLLQEN
jgi:hypothetical protein